eukprot:4776037-Alexandrium_andersonii.AAC.1
MVPGIRREEGDRESPQGKDVIEQGSLDLVKAFVTVNACHGPVLPVALHQFSPPGRLPPSLMGTSPRDSG